ncbi:MAG: endonuclease [Geobacteraceae bacterium GWC2_53_11]|nr:MAG: endonuclease [Geobacteraceae bacterium GWC2_53_11]
MAVGQAGANWQVYIILCSDDTLYTGITTDVQRRFNQHAVGNGAKFFRGRRPLRVVYQESGHTRSSASRRELAIKALTRAEKLTMIKIDQHSPTGRRVQTLTSST